MVNFSSYLVSTVSTENMICTVSTLYGLFEEDQINLPFRLISESSLFASSRMEKYLPSATRSSSFPIPPTSLSLHFLHPCPRVIVILILETRSLPPIDPLIFHSIVRESCCFVRSRKRFRAAFPRLVDALRGLRCHSPLSATLANYQSAFRSRCPARASRAE